MFNVAWFDVIKVDFDVLVSIWPHVLVDEAQGVQNFMQKTPKQKLIY